MEKKKNLNLPSIHRAVQRKMMLEGNEDEKPMYTPY